MAELVEYYSKGLKQKFMNYWPAWPTWTRYSLGDVGTLNDHVFEKFTTLRELGMGWALHEQGASRSELHVTSGSDVSITQKLAGAVDPNLPSVAKAELGMLVSFGRTGAFVLDAPEIYEDEIVGRLPLQSAIIGAIRAGVWQKEWLVITRIVRATSATILISKSSQAQIELAAAGTVGSAGTTLGDASANFSIRRQSGETINTVGGENLTPMFQLSRIKSRMFGEPTFSIRSMSPVDPSLSAFTPSLIDDDEDARGSLVFEPLTDAEVID